MRLCIPPGCSIYDFVYPGFINVNLHNLIRSAILHKPYAFDSLLSLLYFYSGHSLSTWPARVICDWDYESKVLQSGWRILYIYYYRFEIIINKIKTGFVSNAQAPQEKLCRHRGRRCSEGLFRHYPHCGWCTKRRGVERPYCRANPYCKCVRSWIRWLENVEAGRPTRLEKFERQRQRCGWN